MYKRTCTKTGNGVDYIFYEKEVTVETVKVSDAGNWEDSKPNPHNYVFSNAEDIPTLKKAIMA